MSKSLGNTIEPQEIIAKSGAEIIRLWVAMVDYREEIRIGKEILARVVEAYRKLRNTARILAANLFDFDPSRDLVATSALEPVDRYILSRYATLALKVRASYDAFDFQGVGPRPQRVCDGGPQRVLRGRLEGSPLHAGGRLAEPPRGADRDVPHRRRPGPAGRADPAGDRRAVVEGAARHARVVGAPGRVPRGGLARGAGRRRAGRRVAAAAGDPRPGQRRDRGAPHREAVRHVARRARDARRLRRRPGAAAPLRSRPADAVHRLDGDADRRRRQRSGRRRDEGRRREVRALLAHRPVGDAARPSAKVCASGARTRWPSRWRGEPTARTRGRRGRSRCSISSPSCWSSPRWSSTRPSRSCPAC